MWTDEASISYLIFDNVQDETVRRQIYQAFFQIEIFKRFIPELSEAVQTLAFHNFAKSETCHMTEGIFGEAKHFAHMESAKVKVIGLLGIVIPAGHRFLKSLAQAKSQDKKSDWSKFRDLRKLEDLYRRARNACEHLSERIFSGEYSTLEDFSFSIHSKLRFKDPKKGQMLLDFSGEALTVLVQIWRDVLTMLEGPEEVGKVAASKGDTSEVELPNLIGRADV